MAVDENLRQCPGCNELKPPSEFYNRKRDRKCKVCIRARVQRWRDNKRERYLEYSRLYYQEHREERIVYDHARYEGEKRDETLAWHRAYYRTNRERRLEQNRQWVERNRDAVRAYQAEYRAEHRDELRAYYKAWAEQNSDNLKAYSQAYYDANRDRIIVQTRQWALDNPEQARLRGQRCQARRRARKRGAEGSHTKEEWLAVCARYDHRCLCCCQRLPLSIDHVQPISKGGSDWISNIQPLCRPCNRSKAARSWDFRPLWDAMIALQDSIDARRQTVTCR